MGYLSPEIVTSGHYTHKTDIWAAGVILYEMVHGRSFMDQLTDREKYLYLKTVSPTANAVRSVGTQAGRFAGAAELP